MKKTILFITRGKDDASTRYRVAPLIPLLEGAGWQCRQTTRKSRFLRLQILLAALGGKTIFIQRKLFEVGFIYLLAMLRARVIFDFDDAIFVKRSGKSAKRNEARFRVVIRAASLVTAGNKLLANTARAQKPVATILLTPTGVPTDLYDATPASGEKCELVWVGSSSTRKYLDHASEALTAIARQNPGIRLKVISDFEWSHPELDTVCVPWSENGEIGEIKSCLIGIAPMPDNEWTRGKCALKSIQYMAAGLPVIGSNCGTHADVIRNGESGYLVDGAESWASAVNQVLKDPELRNRMAQKSLSLANKEFDLAGLSRETVNAIDAVTAGRLISENKPHH